MNLSLSFSGKENNVSVELVWPPEEYAVEEALSGVDSRDMEAGMNELGDIVSDEFSYQNSMESALSHSLIHISEFIHEFRPNIAFASASVVRLFNFRARSPMYIFARQTHWRRHAL